MTQQHDLFGLQLDDAATRRIGLPQPREPKRRRLPDVLADVPRNWSRWKEQRPMVAELDPIHVKHGEARVCAVTGRRA